jgi:membrane protease YdiL (CAAX protease family)
MKRKATFTGANTVFFAFTAAFLGFQILLAIISIIVVSIFGEKYALSFILDNIYAITLVTELLIVLSPVMIYAVYKKLDFKTVFRLNQPGILPCIIIILAALPAYAVAVMVNTAVIYLLQFIGNIPAQSIPVPENIPELLTGVLFIAVLPAICEEAMHRGLFLSAYENRGTMKAIVITSIFFGIFHFDITNLAGPIFLGLLIGYYVIRTNSIFAGMLAHFLNNTTAEVLQYLFRNSMPASNTITVAFSELLDALLKGSIGLVVLSVLVYAFYRVTRGRSMMKPSISSARGDFRAVMTHWPIIVVIVLYVLMALIYILTIVSSKLLGA